MLKFNCENEIKFKQLENIIDKISSPLNSNHFCQSTFDFDSSQLGNSLMAFCNKPDARIWAISQIESLESKWAGMNFDIIEVVTDKSKVYFSVNFYE